MGPESKIRRMYLFLRQFYSSLKVRVLNNLLYIYVNHPTTMKDPFISVEDIDVQNIRIFQK
jgi:hypothetical protein